MQGRLVNHFRLLLIAVFAACLLDLFVSFFEPMPHEIRWNGISHELVTYPELLREIEESKVNKSHDSISERDGRRCTTRKCVNSHKCLLNPDSRLTVSLLPILQVNGRFDIDHNLLFFRESVLRSEYFIDVVERACLVISAINPFSQPIDEEMALIQNYTCAKVPKANLLLFNFFGMSRLNKLNGSTIVAGAMFHSYDYRPRFDIPIPRYRPYNIFNDDGFLEIGRWEASSGKKPTINREKWHRIGIFVPKSKLRFALKSYREIFGHSQKDEAVFSRKLLCVDVVVLDGTASIDFPSANAPITAEEVFCSTGNDSGGNVKQTTYKEAVSSTFDLLFVDDSVASFEMIVMDVFQGGVTVPAIISDNYLPPFFEVINWNEFSMIIGWALVPRLPFIIAELFAADRLGILRARADRVYHRFFSSISAIVATTLRVVESRIVPGAQPPTVAEWNLLADEEKEDIDGRAVGFCGLKSSSIAYQIGDTTAPMNMDVVVTFDNADRLSPGVTRKIIMEQAVVELVNALLGGFDDVFDVRRVLVVWPREASSTAAENQTPPRFDGIRRNIHSIEVLLLELSALDSSRRIWRSEELWRLLRPSTIDKPDSNKVILTLDGSNYERLTEMLRAGQAIAAYKLWRENAKSAIVFDHPEMTRIQSSLFPAFGYAALYDVDLLKYVSVMNEDRQDGIAGRNCKSLTLRRNVSSSHLSTAHNSPKHHRFQICGC